MNKTVYRMLNLPWPEVGEQESDRALVRGLFGAYAGAHGELTAVSQYFYNSLTGEQDAALADLFALVSQNEMVHLQKLGQLIRLYGGDPRLLSFAGGRPHWWSSGAVSYEKSREKRLRQAIAGEREAVRAYRQLAARMAPQPRALIERIIQDEQHHIELFQRALAGLDGV